MNIGDKLLHFSLPNTDGIEKNTQEFYRKYALLVIFYSGKCPHCEAYNIRLAKLAARFENDDLGIVIVDENYAAETSIVKKIRELTVDFQIDDYLMHLIDTEDHAIASTFGTELTPHVFLFNRNRELVYKGAIDDNWKDEEFVTRVYLEDAIEYTLDGMEYDFPETTPVGTAIGA